MSLASPDNRTLECRSRLFVVQQTGCDGVLNDNAKESLLDLC